jgi:tetratricopeptide (TPR) repeat protein
MMRRRWLWVTLAVIVLAGTAVGVWYGLRHRRSGGPETDPARTDTWLEVAEAFNREPSPLDDETRPMVAVLDELSQAIQHRQESKVLGAFHLDRLVEASTEKGKTAPTGARALCEQVIRDLGFTSGQNNWDRTQVRGVKWVVPGKEVVLIAQHFKGQSAQGFRFRWWLIKERGAWQVSDFQDLLTALRLSVLTRHGLAGLGPAGQMPRWIENQVLPRVNDAMRLVHLGNPLAAEQLLQPADVLDVPPALAANRHIARAMIAGRRGNAQEMRRQLLEADKLYPDIPYVDVLNMTAYGMLRDYEQAVRCGQSFIDLFGPDPAVVAELGFDLEQLSKKAESATLVRRALDRNPAALDAVPLLVRLRICLSDEEKSELGQRLEKVEQPEVVANDLIGEALAARDLRAAEIIAAALARCRPELTEASYQQGRVRIVKGQIDEALPLITAALKEKDPQRRRAYLNGFLLLMVDAGQAVRAYKTVSDSESDVRDAFRILTADLLGGKSAPGPLAELVAAHEQRAPNDPWLSWARGELHLHKKEYAEAEKAFTDGMTKALNQEEREYCRRRRVDTCHLAGEGLRAYREIGPARTTFTQLAYLCFLDLKADALDELLQAHRKADPTDPTLPMWEGELLFQKGRYSEAVAKLREFRKSQGPNSQPSAVVVDRLVRSLVRLRQLDEARTEAAFALPGASLAPALAAAARGDVALTGQELDACIAQRTVQPEAFWKDPDLGPLLLTEPFRDLRKRYPPPAEQFPAPPKLP